MRQAWCHTAWHTGKVHLHSMQCLLCISFPFLQPTPRADLEVPLSGGVQHTRLASPPAPLPTPTPHRSHTALTPGHNWSRTCQMQWGHSQLHHSGCIGLQMRSTQDSHKRQPGTGWGQVDDTRVGSQGRGGTRAQPTDCGAHARTAPGARSSGREHSLMKV